MSRQAVDELAKIIQPTMQVWEFGSGMSTPWLMDRVWTLTSIEHDPVWYTTVKPLLKDAVRYELREPSRYWDMSDVSDASLDLVIIDGIERDRCVEAAIPKLRPGGFMVLDNSDKDMTDPDGAYRRAEELLLKAVKEFGGSHCYFTGYPPGLLAPTQTLIARL